MYRAIIIIALIFMTAASSLAQTVLSYAEGDTEYNCDMVNTLNQAYGDQVYVRFGNVDFTLEQFHALVAPNCAAGGAVAQASDTLFEITIKRTVNLRACAGTNCAVVGQAQPGDSFSVLGISGDWYEIRLDSGRAFVAGWLTERRIAEPAGLLADFQFNSIASEGREFALLYGTSARRGTHWLTLPKPDGTDTVIELQAVQWGAGSEALWFDMPLFFGWGLHEWELLPALLPDSSFYIYLPSNGQIYEFPLVNYVYAGDYQLGFDMLERPDALRQGAAIRVVVADSGQAEYIKTWVNAIGQPAVVPPPAQPPSPSVEAGDGLVTIAIAESPPARAGQEIANYELSYRPAGTDDNLVYITNIDTRVFELEDLSNDTAYEFSIAAINRGGRSPWSEIVLATPSQEAGKSLGSPRG